jgi:putative spermidine/putrescine transport system substrate-binding protein
VEDYQEQEYEFWRRLDEEQLDRRKLLKRGLAAGAGLTIFSLSDVALATRQRVLADPPLRGTPGTMKELVAQAKKEGHLNDIACRPGELRPDHQDLPEALRHPVRANQPRRSSGAGKPGHRFAEGRPAAPDCVDVTVAIALEGVKAGLYGRYFVNNYKTIPRAMKDTRGLWTGDYWGEGSIGYNSGLVSTPPKTFADLLKPEYKNKVALNGSPLQSGSAIAGVFAAALANGGSLNNVGPGIDWFAKCKSVGNFIPVQTTPQTVASGQTPISIDWDYNNLVYITEFPAAKWKVNVPSDASTAGTTARRSTPRRLIRGRRDSGRSSSTPTRGRSCT